MYIEHRNLRGVQNLLIPKLCAGIVSVETWCPRIFAPLYVNWMKFMTIYKKETFWDTLCFTI